MGPSSMAFVPPSQLEPTTYLWGLTDSQLFLYLIYLREQEEKSF